MLPLDVGAVHASTAVGRAPEHIEDVVVGDVESVGVEQLDNGVVHRIADSRGLPPSGVGLAELDLDPDVRHVDVEHSVLMELNLYAVFRRVVVHPEVGAVLCEEFRDCGCEHRLDEVGRRLPSHFRTAEVSHGLRKHVTWPARHIDERHCRSFQSTIRICRTTDSDKGCLS